MIEIGNTIIGFDVLEQKFHCDLSKCNGACCVHGDSGAPLEKEELKIVEDLIPIVTKYMTRGGRKAIKEFGPHLVDCDGDDVTPLINGRECAYTHFKKGIARCAFETAYNEGESNFMKPISCHLYPVRIKKYTNFEGINYDKWEICEPARKLGQEKAFPLYKMLKEPFIRKYGEVWFKQLEKAIENLEDKKQL